MILTCWLFRNYAGSDRGDVWFFFTFFKSSFKIQQNMISIKYV